MFHVKHIIFCLQEQIIEINLQKIKLAYLIYITHIKSNIKVVNNVSRETLYTIHYNQKIII